MKTGTHTRHEPCLNYEESMGLKKLGFNEYTRQSYVGREFVDWMGWSNDFSIHDERWQFPRNEDGSLSKDVLPMIACPTIYQALKWIQRTHNRLQEVNFFYSDKAIETAIKSFIAGEHRFIPKH